MRQKTADIYCRVIDNYGDIGVCWRLARQLRGHFERVRLWVDDLRSFSCLNPELAPHLDYQLNQSIEIYRWHDKTIFPPPEDLLIEAFGCELPLSVQAASAIHRPVWLNLEYLSAEDWVPSFHLGRSPQANGMTKHFFFPGFAPHTGGLLRSPTLLKRRDQFLLSTQAQEQLLYELGLPTSGPDLAALKERRKIFLFCYPHAPVQSLLNAIKQHETALLVPASVAKNHPCLSSKQTNIHIIPPVSQDNFDKILWFCDLNFVRGEDSLVRALWAGKPMVWQPYPQEDNWHLEKLRAWLSQSAYNTDLHKLHYAWSQTCERDTQSLMAHLLDPLQWANWQREATNFSEKLLAGPELSESIMTFYTQMA